MMRILMLTVLTFSFFAAGLHALPKVARAESSLANFRSYPLASRGYNLIEQGRYEDARKMFERAVQIMPSNVDYRLQLANLLVTEQRLAKAHTVVLEGLKLTPNHRGMIMLEHNLRKELAALEVNLPPLPEDPNAKARFISSPYTERQRTVVERTVVGQLAGSSAESYCNTLLADSYNDLVDTAALNAGYCALDEKENAKAIKLFENASYSQDKAIAVQALNQLGFIYIDKNQPQKAAQYWRKSVAIESNKDIEINIARVYRLSGDTEKAKKILLSITEDAGTATETKVAAMRELALLFDEQGSLEQAHTIGEDIIAFKPNASDYYYQALRAQRMGDSNQALKYFEQANQKQPDTFIYMYSLAYAYRADSQFAKAVEMFEKALDKEDSTELRLDYAYSLKEIGERKKAAEQFLNVQNNLDDVEKEDALRREVRDLNRKWTTFGSISYRDGVFSGIDSTGSQLYDDSFQYGIETVYSPEKWQRQGRQMQLYGQIFASSDSSTFNWNQDSTQGAIGARVTPLPDTEWYLYIARLISLGESALDDTQLRTTFSNVDGFEYEATKNDWEYTFFNIDLSYLIEAEQTFATSEARYGRSYKQGAGLVLTPHVVLAGSLIENDIRDSQNLEAGLGVSAKLWKGETETQYPDKSLELIVQWRQPISSDDNKSGPFIRLVGQF